MLLESYTLVLLLLLLLTFSKILTCTRIIEFHCPRKDSASPFYPIKTRVVRPDEIGWSIFRAEERRWNWNNLKGIRNIERIGIEEMLETIFSARYRWTLKFYRLCRLRRVKRGGKGEEYLENISLSTGYLVDRKRRIWQFFPSPPFFIRHARVNTRVDASEKIKYTSYEHGNTFHSDANTSPISIRSVRVCLSLK